MGDLIHVHWRTIINCKQIDIIVREKHSDITLKAKKSQKHGIEKIRLCIETP